MITLRQARRILAAAAALAALATAAAPAWSQSGDPYIPKVPGPGGDEAVGGGGDRLDDPSSLSPLDASELTPAERKAVREALQDRAAQVNDGDPSSSSSSSDDSSGVLDTLLDPLVLLLVAGVLAIAVGMILARRQQASSEKTGEIDAENPGGETAEDRPHTPEGEIVAPEAEPSPDRPSDD